MLLIGARILEYRKAANMSQEEFAVKMGVSRQAVSKWELDKAYPDLDKLMDICEMFHISIDELVNGKTAQETQNAENTEEAQNVPQIKTASLGTLRGTHGTLRLKVCALLAGMLFLFCGTVFILVVSRYSWNQENAVYARVERVYQQYTKADISFSADDSRRVLKTVWLDADGIRDGDYVECYTDSSQRQVFLDYFPSTMIILLVLSLLFLGILLLLAAELRRMNRERAWNVLLEEGVTERRGRNE